MGKFKLFLKGAAAFTRKHSPKILGGLALGGLAGTVIFAIKEAPVAKERMDELRTDQAEKYERGEVDSEKVPMRKVLREVVPIYIPTIGMGLVTAGCIVGSVVAGEKQKAVISGAYAASELALTEYQNKVQEFLGEKKHNQLQDKIAEDDARMHPLERDKVINTGHGHTLCYEPLSARYFYSDADTIKRGATAANLRLSTEMWVSANELFQEWDLEPCGLGEDKGWNPDHPIKLHFTSFLYEDEPVYVIGYVNRPVLAYR